MKLWIVKDKRGKVKLFKKSQFQFVQFSIL